MIVSHSTCASKMGVYDWSWLTGIKGGGGGAPPDVFDLLQNSETNLQNYCAFKDAGTPELIT